MNKRPLSLKDFKDWLSEQNGMSEFFQIEKDREDDNDKYVGKEVRSKVGESKLVEKIESDYDPVQIVSEFLEKGGKVLSVDGRKITIEVDSGEFTLPRFCVKIRKDA